MAEQGKWVGKAAVEIKGIKAEQIWPFVADFCNFHKWCSSVDSCYLVEGTLGEVGVVRCCVSKAFQPVDRNPEGTAWLKEKLIAFDPTQRSLSYQVVDNNVGLSTSYVGTHKVWNTAAGCEIEWAFVTEPVEGWKSEDFVSFFEATLPSVANKMEAEAKAAAA